MRVAMLCSDSREVVRQYTRSQPRFGSAPEALLQGLAQLPDVEVHVVSCLQRPAPFPDKISPNIFYHGLVVPKMGWMRTGYQGCIRAVRKKLREIQPDIVHGQGTERDCAISAVLSGFPNLVTVHGSMCALAQLHQARFGTFGWLAGKLENFILPRAGGIICISDYVMDLVKKYGTPTWLVPNAIQKMFFDFPRTPSATSTRPLLINIGVISERKRQLQVLAMMESLRAEGLDFETLFVGRVNPQSGYAAKFTAALEQTSRKYDGFKHIPTLDDESFCRLFDQASAMIHFSNEESFGLVFAEAIARGLYLFASDVGSSRDIARGVDRAQIFGLNDWDQLKDAIREWLRSGGALQARPSNPPEEFTNRFYPTAVARRHLEIYQEVLASQKRKP